MGTLDSREYDRLVEREFRDYSEGHRYMYLEAIRQIEAECGLKGRPVDIFEAGFGIGYGLKKMLEAGIVRSYTGCEPQADSFNYTAGEAAKWAGGDFGKLSLLHAPFDSSLVSGGQSFEHVFCVEVIEHVPLPGHSDFLEKLRSLLAPGGTLWLSTPCIKRNAREGVRPTEEWEYMLHEEGFAEVVVDRSRWTYLYRCRG